MQGAAFVFEAAPEKLPLKQQIFAELESDRRAGRDPRQQQFGDPVDRDRPPSQASRARHRHAFLESAASGAAGRGHPERKDRRQRRRRDHGAVARRREGAGPCPPRRAGLRRQPAAARDEARGDSRWSPPVSATPTPSISWSAKVLARAPPCSGRWSRPTWSGSISTSTLPRCSTSISTAPPGRTALLRDKVKAGKLGMKTGEGMRKWTPEAADAVRSRLSRFLAAQAKARESRLRLRLRQT